jgi:hypothetical protein
VRIFPKWTQLQPCHMAPFFGNTPTLSTYPTVHFTLNMRTAESSGRHALVYFTFFLYSKSNPIYGLASNMGTCLQVVERTCVQLYRPTMSFTLWVLCFLHAKYSIHPGYKMFLTGLENTFLLCSGDQPKKHWWFTHWMRSPKLDENLYASINQTGIFYS